MRNGHQRGNGRVEQGRQQPTQENGARGYQGSDYNSRGDTRGHGMREYHQPDYAQRDFSQRDFNERSFQHHDFGPADRSLGQPVRDYGPTFGDGRGNQFDGRSDGPGGRGTQGNAGGGHMDWSTGQDWHARPTDFEERNTRGLGWDRAGESTSQPRPNMQPSHRGKGPKGFKRSDDRIREAVSEELHDDHDVDASDITVEVKDGEVTLTGTVDGRQMKRMAEDIAGRLPGVHDVVNQLRVKRAEAAGRESDPEQPAGRNGSSGKSASS